MSPACLSRALAMPALALLLSIGAELGQIVIPFRQPSLRDVLANALGAVLGAVFAWLVVLRRHQKRTASLPAPAE